jgi:phosphopantothenoylcysteine decarboxylase / phosphopantothenate---cysteine ligase
MLDGKSIVLGVAGGIAAYKAVEIVSRLKKAGASVHVIMTEAATHFITPLTFQEISGNPVVTSLWSEAKQWQVEHIALANLADLFVIAPATADIMGKIAAGIADDMLSTTVMATKAPVVLVPAMNSAMFLNPIVQSNMDKLRQLGYQIMEPESGLLACGAEGPGRLPEPEKVVSLLITRLQRQSTLSGRRILVTAGGTREPIDPVRYISNRSSGKMGYALAAVAAERGGNVILVSGPTWLPCPPGVTLYSVETAAQMQTAVLKEYPTVDVVIKAAAVADYRPQMIHPQKLKKTGEVFELVLEKTTDILLELGRRKQHQILVGFAAETQELLVNASEKLARKNLDMIVANDVTLPGAGFNSDTNIVKLLFADGHVEELPQLPKNVLAGFILDKISGLMIESSPNS